MALTALALSDVQVDFIYSPVVRTRFAHVDLVIGCGDLPYYYLEYVANALDLQLFYVRGNHNNPVEHTLAGARTEPLGGIDLHGRVTAHRGLLLAGVEGSLRYSSGLFQYSQNEMWRHVLRLVPALLANRSVYGRFLDVFVSHAPPWGIHDQPDLPHQGIHAFRWLLQTFRPAYHFHGHIHTYRSEAVPFTRFHETQVVNSYGFVETEVAPARQGAAPFRFLVHLERKGVDS